MLSVLIPIYNDVVVHLVKNLQVQLTGIDVPFEIICLDDGSEPRIKAKNRAIDGLLGVNYVELSNRCGRAKIRNKLVQLARYEALLFLDGDSRIYRTTFISQYVGHINELEDTVYVGGRIYADNPPRDPTKYLHWLYGRKRESRMTPRRLQNPAEYFHTNNFLIHRQILLQCPFDETLVSYGYEDLELAKRLLQSGKRIKHINNPVRHGKLEKAKVFLSKQKEGTLNLVALYQKRKISSTRLTRAYEFLNKTGLSGIVLFTLSKGHKKMEKNLLGSKPHLFILDSWKLYHFANQLHRQSK